MNKYVLALALAVSLVVGGAGAAYGRQAGTSIVPTIKVNTPTGTLLTLKTSELASCRSKRHVTLNGVSTVEQGPTLASLLTLAGVQYNAACKNDELRWWIEATASNGRRPRSPPARSTRSSATGRRSSRSARTVTS